MHLVHLVIVMGILFCLRRDNILSRCVEYNFYYYDVYDTSTSKAQIFSVATVVAAQKQMTFFSDCDRSHFTEGLSEYPSDKEH